MVIRSSSVPVSRTLDRTPDGVNGRAAALRRARWYEAGPDGPGDETMELAPRFLNGLLEIPVHHVRGGTSTGVVLDERRLPADSGLREEAIRNLMGVPLAGEAPGNRQLAGLGRGVSTSNKVFLIEPSTRPGADLDSTLAQLAADKSAIDWTVNCGNMTAALPHVAFELGMLAPKAGENRIRIRNRNTGVVTEARLAMPGPGEAVASDTEIPGVLGVWPGVALSLAAPAGAVTGKLFPTGARAETVGGVAVSCVDFAMPMVIARAAALGATGGEPPEALDADAGLKARMREVRVAAGLRMGLAVNGRKMTAEELAVSETVPKMCLIAPPDAGEAGRGVNVRARYFTPQSCHRAMAVTGGACLAAACLIPGTVASAEAAGLAPLPPAPGERRVRIGNPAGVLEAAVTGSEADGAVEISAASYMRSAQILLRGHTPIYAASEELRAHYRRALAAG